ncbi:MAG: hypothetical protein QNJ22_08345 [Desulfosarcinaceae bacterium]|nr:hypothetical protein [Desulfosarcinaceae bacterium]
MTTRYRIQRQYTVILAGLALGLATGLAGLFWWDSRLLLLCGMLILAITIVAGERTVRCPACGRSVYAEIAREAAFTPRKVPLACPKCQAQWAASTADGEGPVTDAHEEPP